MNMSFDHIKMATVPQHNAILISQQHDEEEQGLLIPLVKAGQLVTLQELVQGHVEYLPHENGMVIVCNADAIPAGLPHNSRATYLLGQPLYGPVVLCNQSILRLSGEHVTSLYG